MLIDAFTLFGSWPGLPNDHPLEHLADGLQRYHLDHACTLSTKGIFFDAAEGNRATWEACRQETRLIPIGVIDPRIRGEEQIDYCVNQGFRLLALFPETQGWQCDNLVMRQLFRRLGEANLPVLIEATGDGAATAILAATRELALPVILHDVSLRTLTEATAVIRERPNTFVTTRLLCGGDTIEMLIGQIGAEQLIFTSRFPISCFSSAFLTAKYADIGEAERTAILGGNMAGLLSIH